MATVDAQLGVGAILRDWRQRRRLSQLDLALDAGVSARHLSFLETGRSRPSAPMVLRLAEQLEVPLRERNRMLLAAGFAPAFPERSLDDPELTPVREALELILSGNEPYPALAVDRHWEMVAANAPIAGLLSAVDPALLEPPANVLRISLHPDGLAPQIINLGEWKAHLLERLKRQATISGDPALAELHAELEDYPAPAHKHGADSDPGARELLAPLRLRSPDGGVLALLSTISTFGTAVEVTMSELSIESFFPADTATAKGLEGLSRR